MECLTAPKDPRAGVTVSDCRWLAQRYHQNEPSVHYAARNYAPENFIRLFTTAHGMPPRGTWQTHTYARVTQADTGLNQFFLVPMPFSNPTGQSTNSPRIEMKEGRVWLDQCSTPMRAQSIPYTTPFWYFHYDPNAEQRPFESMTLNLSPSCPENCTLCAGAKTGRVNNGISSTLSPKNILKRVFTQHPQAAAQLDSVAVVTGCFENFEALASHLREVREAVREYSTPRTFRVLEHNVIDENDSNQLGIN